MEDIRVSVCETSQDLTEMVCSLAREKWKGQEQVEKEPLETWNYLINVVGFISFC